MYTGDIAETNPENGIFSIFGHAVTLTFDLLTPVHLCPKMLY